MNSLMLTEIKIGSFKGHLLNIHGRAVDLYKLRAYLPAFFEDRLLRPPVSAAPKHGNALFDDTRLLCGYFFVGITQDRRMVEGNSPPISAKAHLTPFRNPICPCPNPYNR